MSRIVRTARGESVDFDAIIIKQQLAQAPMNIEVARRKEFIDSKENKTRGQSNLTADILEPVQQNSLYASNEPVRVVSDVVIPSKAPVTERDFEISNELVPGATGRVEEPVPIIRERKK